MVAGYGAGKSEAAVVRIAMKALQYPKAPFGFVEPTFDLVRLIGFPRFSSVLESWGVDHSLNKQDAILTLENDSTVIFRSADNPERMVGFEVADAVVDEADTLRPQQANDVWVRMLGRCRWKKPDGAPNTLGAVSTPEGFGFMYERWQKSPAEGYELIRAPTGSNPYLPAGYIDSLKATYSSALLAAYLEGEFVNLHAGSVYPEFDRALNHSGESIRSGEPLHIGLDFNVTKMAAVVFVLRDGKPHAVGEYTNVFDTPAMIALIKSRHTGHAIYAYPDASGGSRKSQDASVTDLALLRGAGFHVCVPNTNPAVKDRVLSVNAVLRSRDLRVNIDRCPSLVESLEKQAYDKNGEPDKKSGFDHVIDAAGYFISYKFPLVKQTASFTRLRI